MEEYNGHVDTLHLSLRICCRSWKTQPYVNEGCHDLIYASQGPYTNRISSSMLIRLLIFTGYNSSRRHCEDKRKVIKDLKRICEAHPLLYRLTAYLTFKYSP